MSTQHALKPSDCDVKLIETVSVVNDASASVAETSRALKLGRGPEVV